MSVSGDLSVYRRCPLVVEEKYDPATDQSIAECIIMALADAEDVPPTALPPLYDAIDLEAVEQLFERHTGLAGTGAFLSFQYERWNVFVRADGRIQICDGTEHTDAVPVFPETV